MELALSAHVPTVKLVGNKELITTITNISEHVSLSNRLITYTKECFRYTINHLNQVFTQVEIPNPFSILLIFLHLN